MIKTPPVMLNLVQHLKFDEILKQVQNDKI
jgi:hypothetical protein